jgi:predicted dehydrogenase
MAALRGGKHVYCEWPLGANTAEALEMASLARDKGLVTLVGLQARADPSINYLRDLVAQGYAGEVLSATLTLMSPGALVRTSDRTWQGDRTLGANTLTILHGHAIDILCYCLDEFEEVAARVTTRVPVWQVTDTGGSFRTDSPDQVLVSGLLAGGAVATVHVASIPYNGSAWRLEVYGREGTLVATSSQMPQMADVRLLGARGRDALAELSVPESYVTVPEGTPKGPPFNVGQMYTRLADALHNGGVAQPDFDLAVQRHRLIDAIQQASDEGRTVRVG